MCRDGERVCGDGWMVRELVGMMEGLVRRWRAVSCPLGLEITVPKSAEIQITTITQQYPPSHRKWVMQTPTQTLQWGLNIREI